MPAPRVIARWLLPAFGIANACLYSMLLPLWEGFDEPFHFAYVQSLASGQGFPDPRTSRLSQEEAQSLLLAPASLSVQRNLPDVIAYPQFFALPPAARAARRRRLFQIDPALRWRPSQFIDYEGLQAPLAYALLAMPERLLAGIPLPARVLALRILGATIGALLLYSGARRLARQLAIPEPHSTIAVFCAFCSQMLWATLAHVANDWLALPLALWLLVATIDWYRAPNLRRAAIAAAILAAGLLTKAYFIAFVPLLAAPLFRRQFRDAALALAVVLAFAGPWYLRNIARYGTLSAMQELRQGARPAAALRAVRLAKIPAALDSYARQALWTANNSFRSFSVNTLRAILAVWLAALILWTATKHRAAEWLAIAYAALFLAALAYDTAINFVASRGETISPGAWYVQVLLMPMLALALLGAARWRRAGAAAAAAMVLLFGYVLMATYWIKLIPLYSGFPGRATPASLAALYGRLPTLMAALNDVCLAPAALIVAAALTVSILAIAQQILLLRQLLQRPATQRFSSASPRPCGE